MGANQRERRLTGRLTINLTESELEKLRSPAAGLPLAIFARLLLTELLRVQGREAA